MSHAVSPQDRFGVDESCLEWTKAAASGTGNCIEVSAYQHHVLVRDSKDPHGPIVCFTSARWSDLLIGIRGGDFDRL